MDDIIDIQETLLSVGLKVTVTETNVTIEGNQHD
jgi:hypothetical protein